MSKFKRLGRGLKDISYLFLSSEQGKFLLKEDLEEKNGINASSPGMKNKYICLVGDETDFYHAFLVLHLSFALARLGMRIVLVDMDEGLPCLHFFMGNEVRSNISTTPDSLIETGSSGVKLVGLSKTSIKQLLNIEMNDQILLDLEKIENDVDLVLVSTMQNTLLQMDKVLAESMKEFIIFVSPDDDKMLEAYRIMKVLFSRNPMAKVGTVVTGIDYMIEVDRVNNKMSGAVKKFLDKELYKYGFLYKIKREFNTFSNSSSVEDNLTACLSNIAQIIMHRLNLDESSLSSGLFFKRIFAEHAH